MTDRYERVESPDSTTIFEYHDLTPPTIADVYRARKVISKYLPRTPLVRSEPLSRELNADVYLKREDTLPTGAFKVRGGVNLGTTLPERFHDPGLIAASTGNHGQSVAYAGRAAGVPVVICVPNDPNPDKKAAMEALGADVIENGDTYDEAREHAEELAATEGYRYIHSANEPKLVAGVATAGLEIIEDKPAVDTLFCPVGGGSSAAGYGLTVGTLADVDVIGVTAEAAPALYHAFHEGHLDPGKPATTTAEGIASSVPFALTMEIMRQSLTDMRTVSETAIREAVRYTFDEDHLVVEGASAAAIAAVREADDLSGQTVVIPVSGRNIDGEKFRRFLDE